MGDSVGEYRKLNRLGQGTYGIVYRARHSSTERIVALKRLRMDVEGDGSGGMPLSSLREISLLRRLRHENIVSLLDVVVGSAPDQVFMGVFPRVVTTRQHANTLHGQVMEYCEQDMGHLLDTIISKGPGYSPPQGISLHFLDRHDTLNNAIGKVKCLVKQLLQGLSYMHKKFVIHRDLKLTNLLLTNRGILKIADFGLARPFGLPARPLTPRVVTLWYRAPEILYGSRDYTTAIDIWAAGCILGELLQSRPLLPGTVEINQLALIHQLLGSPSEEIWPGFDALPHAHSLKLPRVKYDSLSAVFPKASEGTKDLLKRLLTYCPEGRLTASKALKHEYFTSELPRPCDPALLPTYPELRNDQDSSVMAAVQRAQKRRKHEATFGK